MSQTSTNIIPKYCQETRYNYAKNSVFFASNCSPLLCYRSVTTALTAQIPAETLSQSHRLCFMLLCYNHAKTTTFSAQSSTGKTCSPLLHYHCVNHANSCGNAIANSLGLLHAETGFSYFGARYYDSDILTGWLSVDPMADKYPSLSPYAYCAWNPVRLVDPDGEEIHLTFSTYVKGVNTSKELKRIIDGGLGGQFEAIYTKNSNGSYKLSLRATNNGGDITKLTDQQRDFYVELSNIINGEKIAKVDVVYGSRDVVIGSYTNNAIDVADIDQFDNLGEGPCTKQGKLIHELVEQYYKADNGIVKGSDKNYNEAHYYNGIPSENKINRYYRKDLSPIRSTYTQSYTDKKGHKTEYTYNSKDPILKVSKYIKN